MYEAVSGQRPSTSRGDRLPVEGVSWWDAVEFCNALSDRDGLTRSYELDQAAEHAHWVAGADGWRLPTEAEWEHACRGGTTGAGYGELSDIAWRRSNAEDRVHEVAGRQPNPWGLFDMLVNVWGWGWDVYDAEVYGSSGCCVAVAGPTNPGAAGQGFGAAATRRSGSTTSASASPGCQRSEAPSERPLDRLRPHDRRFHACTPSPVRPSRMYRDRPKVWDKSEVEGKSR